MIEKLYKIFKRKKVVSTDSRSIVENAIFFALRGENFDGNEHANKALSNGASYAILDNAKYYDSQNPKHIFVEDTLKALQDLATYHRQKIQAKIIGITGSNGKTTTKELIYKVLSRKYKTRATVGNLNNHIGVPLTLLAIDEDVEFAVVEMGANHLGEIAFLCQIARPDYGILTNTGKAHIEGFGSYENVVKTKNELYQFIGKNKGMAFVNQDNDLLMDLSRSLARTTYGISLDSDCRGQIISKLPLLQVSIFENEKSIPIKSNLTGAYNFENIMAAVCVGKYFGLSTVEISSAIESYMPDNSRSQIINTANGNRIIMDAYNANPTSMKAALDNFASVEANNKTIILGDMLELGDSAYSEHSHILRMAQEINPLFLLLIGQHFSEVTKDDAMCFEDSEKLAVWLKQNPIKDHQILIKGSRGIKLEKVIKSL